MQVDRVGYNLDPLTLNNTELNGYSCRRIAIAIIVDNDTKQVDRSREQEDQPQQSPTQIFLNHSHRVQSNQVVAGNGPRIEDYSVTAGN